MVKLKRKYLIALPWIGLLILFSLVQTKHLREYYDEILNSTGLVFEDFDKKLREENDRAIQDGEDYQRLLKAEGIDTEENPEQEGGEGKEQINTKAKTEPVKLKLHARSALLMDASNNRILYEENGYKRMSMASTTKIMTCIVTLENAKLDEVVEVSSYAASMPDVQLNIKRGEQYYLKDLLYSLMLESHNDVAVAIAEYVGGSVEGFATMMNDKARELGCENTNFVTPNGLDAQGHYTTARDLAVIASYAVKNPQFIEITNTSSYSFHELKKGRGFTVTNKNKFLYMMEGAIGVKTGFTGDAGYCFVGAVKRQDSSFISVVLGCGWPPNKSLKWSDTKVLMNFGVNNYKPRQIFEEQSLKPLLVKKGQNKLVELKMTGNLKLLMRDDETVSTEYHLPDYLDAPVESDKAIGDVKYYINGEYYATIPIYTRDAVKRIDFPYCLQRMMKLWTGNYSFID
jgi:serine-type D-Ala-D-Ala carboxypeptidase (penicillin-binding protein 5/6)